MGFHVLIADDKGDDIDKAINIISKSIIGENIDEIYTCQYIKTKFNCPPSEKTFLEIIDNVDDLHFAFVDLSWDDHGELSNYSDGGKFIIEKILKKNYPNCLIIPLTKEIGENIAPSDQTFNFRTDSAEILFESISKKASSSQQIDRFNNLYFTKWLLPFIKKINDTEYLTSLQGSLKKDHKVEQLKILQKEWDLGGLIANIPEKKKEIINFIDDCLDFTFPCKIYNWANPKKHSGGRPSKSGLKKPDSIDLVEVYKQFISSDRDNGYRKTNYIDKLATDILTNRLERCLSDSDKPLLHPELSISKVEIYNLDIEIPESFFNLLIWRRVILGWIKYANLYSLPDMTETINIFQDCIGKSYDGSKYATLNNTFTFLGFKRTNTGYLDPVSLLPSRCFKEENSWLSELDLKQY